jgi:steroid 5-alpha reductase family enzyme
VNVAVLIANALKKRGSVFLKSIYQGQLVMVDHMMMACLSAADFQKDWFKRQPGNKGEFVRTGLYYLCQFPNYFAEISVWWTMFFWAGFPSVFISHPWIIASPIFTTILLRFVSGVSNLAEGQQKRCITCRFECRRMLATPTFSAYMTGEGMCNSA